jgi:hypothetical protein
LRLLAYEFENVQEISDHHQNWEYVENPWKGPGPSLQWIADLLKKFWSPVKNVIIKVIAKMISKRER